MSGELPPRHRCPFIRFVALIILISSLAVLTVGAVHGARSTAALAGARQLSTARLDDAYYDCLDTQARSVARPGELVDVLTSNPSAWVTLVKVVAPWAVITTRATRAHITMTLVPRRGANTCLGSVVVARSRSGAVQYGSGATLRGGHPPSPTL
jgi:hypothetical protein